jgi:cation diffusion facilitator CzcD-associated flavoprotein CzcO
LVSLNAKLSKMEKLRAAVVGTGPAGLVAAFALHNDLQSCFDVTIFEAVNI